MKRKYVRTGIVLALLLLIILGIRACGSGKKNELKDQSVMTEGNVLEEEGAEDDESASNNMEDDRDLNSEKEESGSDFSELTEKQSGHTHTFTVNETSASCETPGSRFYVCTICGYHYEEEIAPTGHLHIKEGNTLDGDVLRTVYICADCGKTVATYKTAIKSENDHEDDKDNNHDHGYEAHKHAYTKTVIKEATCTKPGSAFFKCSCGASYEAALPAKGHDYQVSRKEEPTCAEPGMLYEACTVCGIEREAGIIDKLPHDFETEIVKEASCEEAGKAVDTCKACGYSEEKTLPAKGHDFTESILTEAGCETDGEKLLTCSTCGKEEHESIPATGHTPSEEWNISAEPSCEQDGERIKECTVCGKAVESEAIPALGHDLKTETVTAPGCETAGEAKTTCTRCDYEETEVLEPIGHDWCNVESKAPTCTEDGYTKLQCDNCGETKEMVRPATGHGLCHWVVTKEPTETEDGQRQWQCGLCGAALKTEVIPKLEHEHHFDTVISETKATCTTDGKIVRQCACTETETETVPATGHAAGEFVTVKEPTYTEMGIAEQRCVNEGCNYLMETKELPVLPHEHLYEKDTENSRPATCTQDGLDVKVCSICKDTVTETIEATGHAAGEAVVKVEASCETEGRKETACTVCGTVMESEVIPATGHVASDWTIVTPPGCESEGLQVKTCITCKKELKQEVVLATGHAYGDWIIDKEPTEEAPGSKHKECANCGDIITEDIEQLPVHKHEWTESGRTESTCTTAGSVSYSCECGETYSEPLPFAPHTPGDWVTVKEPTETEDGLKQKTCTVCGTVTDEETIGKIPHEHVYTAVTTDATCTEDGKTVYTCACGDSYEERIAAKGHSFGEAVVTEPDCDTDGSAVRTCTTCGETDTTVLPMTGHNYVEVAEESKAATCTEDGKLVKRCENCQNTVEDVIPKLGHDYETITEDATCTKEGFSKDVCTVCGDETNYETIEMLPHEAGDWTVEVEPTLGHAGTETIRCIHCDTLLDTREIPALTEDGQYKAYEVKLSDGTTTTIYGYYDTERADMFLEKLNDYRDNYLGQLLKKSDALSAWTPQRGPQLAVLFAHAIPETGKFPNIGENALYHGYYKDAEASVQATWDQWWNSEAHQANMIEGNYEATAVVCFIQVNEDGNPYREYWVETFDDTDDEAQILKNLNDWHDVDLSQH